jgi:NADH-quinone oxidoreductase subunit D
MKDILYAKISRIKHMALATEPFILNIGPLHPSTHGVFRMRVILDGEIIEDVEPVFGYLHRGLEKLCEQRTYKQNIPLTDRLDYVSAINNNWPYVMAVEQLAGIQVPQRAEYLRVIMGELQRIASHLLAVGSVMNDMGIFYTAFMYMFREREKILDLLEMVTGQRLLYNYMRFSGVSQDIPTEFLPALDRFLKVMPGYLDEYDRMLADNEILCARLKGIGVLKPKQR